MNAPSPGRNSQRAMKRSSDGSCSPTTARTPATVGCASSISTPTILIEFMRARTEGSAVKSAKSSDCADSRRLRAMMFDGVGWPVGWRGSMM